MICDVIRRGGAWRERGEREREREGKKDTCNVVNTLH